MAAAPILRLDGFCLRASQGAVAPALSFTVAEGELHVVQSEAPHHLASALMGHPGTGEAVGRLILDGDDITTWPTDVRAKAGMFLVSGAPPALPGVRVADVLRQALAARRGIEVNRAELDDLVRPWTDRLGVDALFLDTHLDDHAPDGPLDHVRAEFLQLGVLDPDVVIIDLQAPSAAVVDLVVAGIDAVRTARPSIGIILVADPTTVDDTLLDHLTADHIHGTTNHLEGEHP